jgi:hypothetical protein
MTKMKNALEKPIYKPVATMRIQPLQPTATDRLNHA